MLRKKKKSRFYQYWKWIFGFIDGLAVVIGYKDTLIKEYNTYFPHKKEFKPIFSENDSTYNILILPFLEYCEEGTLDIGKALTQRLNRIKEEDSLKVKVYYLEKYNPTGNFARDTAYYYQELHNADLIVYGNYTGDYCSGKGNQVCINYRSKAEVKLENTDNKQKKIEINELNEGKLLGDIDFLIYYISV